MTKKRPISLLLMLCIAAPAALAQQAWSEARARGNPQPAATEAAAEPASAAVQPGDAADAARPAVGAAVGEDYVIGPDDTIQIFVWQVPELTITLPIRPDGKFSSPLVEDMLAVGKTPSALARDIEAVLAEYVRTPQVNVIVVQARSTFSQIKVIGEVANPQSLAYREGLTVLDVILAVGGLGDFARGNDAHIIRKVDGKEKKIPIKLKDLLNKGELKYNLLMAPGDVLVVPKSRF